MIPLQIYQYGLNMHVLKLENAYLWFRIPCAQLQLVLSSLTHKSSYIFYDKYIYRNMNYSNLVRL